MIESIQLSVVNNLRLHCFYFTLLCYLLRKLMYQPIRCKTQTNYNLVILVLLGLIASLLVFYFQLIIQWLFRLFFFVLIGAWCDFSQLVEFDFTAFNQKALYHVSCQSNACFSALSSLQCQ